jgi:surface polysaccharide O-acyltransferase-like enzyme
MFKGDGNMIIPIVVCALAVVVLVQLIPIHHKAYRIFQALCAAAFVTVLCAAGVYRVAEKALYTRTMSIEALGEANSAAEGTEVFVRGLLADGNWIDAQAVFDDSWLSDGGKIFWRSYEVHDGYPTMTVGRIFCRNSLTVVFESNKWRGKAAVRLNAGEPEIFDCFSATEFDQDASFVFADIQQDSGRTLEKLTGVCTILLFAALSAALLYPRAKRGQTAGGGRDRVVYIDLLKIAGALAIVLLHLMSPYQFMDSPRQWKISLLLNSATRFAVPVFLMISGNFLLSGKNDSRTPLKKRLFRLAIPLLFWSLCYIVIDNWESASWNIGKELLTMPFNHKHGHLWYIYNLIELYLLAPILIPLYSALSDKRRLYFIAVGLLIPGTCDMLKNLIGLPVPNIISLTWTHIGIAEICLAFLGKFLYDHREALTKRVAVLAAGGGYALIVLGNGYLSMKNTAPAEAFFAHTSLPSVLFGVGVFLLFALFEKRLNALGAGAKSVLSTISGLTLGTYFMHMFVIIVLGWSYPAMWEKLKSCQNVLWIGGLVFLFCMALTFVLSQIPGVKKLVG